VTGPGPRRGPGPLMMALWAALLAIVLVGMLLLFRGGEDRVGGTSEDGGASIVRVV